MSRSKVAVIKTSPETVFEDTAKVMKLAGYQDVLSPEVDTALKINISWAKFYPACSTTPWQLEGVIRTLLKDGFSPNKIHACHNRTVVVSAKRGEINNKHKLVVDAYGLRNIHLYEKTEPWIRYEPKGETKVLHEIYPEGLWIPKRLVGENVIHLPTMKTHVFTTITGAMKNAFGGLLNEKRHWTHSVIHETLGDLLMIQKEIHAGLFAVTDGTVSGDGPGPRCMNFHLTNTLLASSDQVAIDAVAAKIMGFDPMSLAFIRSAAERGLGSGELADIDIVGDGYEGAHWNFTAGNTLASKGQHMIYHGFFSKLEKFLLRTPLVVWAYVASWAYHDWYWYPLVGWKRVKKFMATNWGQRFKNYKPLGPD